MILLARDSLCTCDGFSILNMPRRGIAEYCGLYIFDSIGIVKFLSDIAVHSHQQSDTVSFATRPMWNGISLF